jgi:hypothetical protein
MTISAQVLLFPLFHSEANALAQYSFCFNGAFGRRDQLSLDQTDRLDLRPGDSVLLPHCPDAWDVEESGMSADSGAHSWRLASLTLLLPDVLEQHPLGDARLGLMLNILMCLSPQK